MDFWYIIDKLGWRTLCKKGVKQPYTETKKILNEITNGDETFKKDILYYTKLYRKLLVEKISEYSIETYGDDHVFPAVSDDTYWDLTAHIVGCGKSTYDKVMEYPETLMEYLNEYVENFEYTFY